MSQTGGQGGALTRKGVSRICDSSIEAEDEITADSLASTKLPAELSFPITHSTHLTLQKAISPHTLPPPISSSKNKAPPLIASCPCIKLYFKKLLSDLP